MITRRQAVFGGLVIGIPCACGASAPSKIFHGCFATLRSNKGDTPKLNLSRTSYFDEIDTLLLGDYELLSNTFKVRPAFSFFEEATASDTNAFATTDMIDPNRPDGSILYGVRFAQRCKISADGEVNPFATEAIRAVLAHEFAHIFQYRYASKSEDSTTSKELQADFLASWHCRCYDDFSRWSLSHTFHSLGDSEYSNPDHHGSSPQRLVMATEGWFYRQEFPKATVQDAANRAKSHIRIVRGGIAVRPSRSWFDDGSTADI